MSTTKILMSMVEKLSTTMIDVLTQQQSRIKALEARLATLERAGGKSAGALRMKAKDDHGAHRAGDLVRDADGTVWHVVAIAPRPRYRRVDE